MNTASGPIRLAQRLSSLPGHRTTVRQLPEHESEEDQASREEGHRVRHGREVRAALLVRVLHRVRGVQLPGLIPFIKPRNKSDADNSN